MKKEIKERIEAVRRGEMPEGYRRTKDIGIAPLDWKVGQMSDVLHNETRAVSKPDEPYWRLGIRSWAKGTFQAYVDDPKTVDMDELYVVRENDLVVNITFAWEHAIAVASKEDDGLLVSHRFPTYVFDDGNVPAYYRAVVSQRFFKDMLDHISPGGAGRNRVLNRKDFLALPCYIPSIAEQQKIAKILATCDRVIELKQQLLEEKRRQKKWLMQKLLDPNAGVNQPECSGVKWITRCIMELGTVITGSTPDKSCDEFWGGDFPWITSQDFTGKYIGIAEVHVTDAGKKKCRVLPAGAVLVTCIASIGLNAIAKVECATNQQINAVICNGICSEEMLYYIIEYNRGALERIAGKTAVPIISKDQFEKIKVTIPESRSEQDKITKVLSAADSEIQLLQNELEIWQQKKKALMQLLLTGLVRVNA